MTYAAHELPRCPFCYKPLAWRNHLNGVWQCPDERTCGFPFGPKPETLKRPEPEPTHHEPTML